MNHFLRRASMALAYALPCLLLAACSLGFNRVSSSGKYLIVDQQTGQILTEIDVAPGTTRPERIISYGPNRQITREQQLQYDAQGRLIRRSVVVDLASGGTSTDVTTYTYHNVLDASGRLLETQQFSSKGGEIDTHYGYDSAGNARGVVVQNGKDLMMKDYPQ